MCGCVIIISLVYDPIVSKIWILVILSRLISINSRLEAENLPTSARKMNGLRQYRFLKYFTAASGSYTTRCGAIKKRWRWRIQRVQKKIFDAFIIQWIQPDAIGLRESSLSLLGLRRSTHAFAPARGAFADFWKWSWLRNERDVWKIFRIFHSNVTEGTGLMQSMKSVRCLATPVRFWSNRISLIHMPCELSFAPRGTQCQLRAAPRNGAKRCFYAMRRLQGINAA